jgi:hypothetical protein
MPEELPRIDLLPTMRRHLVWRGRLLHALHAREPGPTRMITGALVATQFARMLAFLLPLKVLLLAGSPGVPGYFQPFVRADMRATWIVVLTAGAFLLYGTSIFLNLLVRRWTNRTTDRFVAARFPPDKAARETRRVRRDLVDVNNNHADSVVFVLGLLALAVLNPRVFLGLLLVLGLLVLIMHRILTAPAGSGPSVRLRKWIAEDYAAFLQAIGAAGFLCVFVLLLADYVLFNGANLILAIMVLILGRLVFSALSRFLTTTVRLEREQESVGRLGEVPVVEAPEALTGEQETPERPSLEVKG